MKNSILVVDADKAVRGAFKKILSKRNYLTSTLSQPKRVLNVIASKQPDIVILETGANDGLRGIDPGLIQKNIREIVRILKARNILVILAGMRMVENMGKQYTAAFGAVYPAVAEAEDLIFMPFFLQGVAGETQYNQPDGIHPTPEGYRIITEIVYPYVIEAIKRLDR